MRLPIADSASAVNPAAEPRQDRLAGRRVLVADDNKDAAESLAMLLELAGHEVRVVHDGRAALSLAHTFRPEVAFLDIGMPQLNGHGPPTALRLQPWGADVYLTVHSPAGARKAIGYARLRRASTDTSPSPWTRICWKD